MCKKCQESQLNLLMIIWRLNTWRNGLKCLQMIDYDTPKKSVIPQPKIEGFTSKPEKKSKEEVISRLALDNIPFSTISRSEMMREYFKIGGIDLPKSHTFIRSKKTNWSWRFPLWKNLEEDLVWHLDEHTSQRNRRYLNINAHCGDKVFCLVLCRVEGSMPSEALYEKVKIHIEKFGLDLSLGVPFSIPSSFNKCYDLTNFLHIFEFRAR